MNRVVKTLVTENLIFLLIAFLPFASMPVIALAQQGNQPEVFIEPLNVSRGKLMPQSNGGAVWPKDYYCDIVKREWGGSNCNGLDAFIVNFSEEVDTLLLEKPNSDGFVKFDDWNSKDKDKEINSIEKALVESLKSQSENIGSTISFEGWRATPVLDQEKNIMFYATDIAFDGEITTNIKASLFDRYGYHVFRIVPYSSSLTQPEIKRIVRQVTAAYLPTVESNYSSFKTGDNIAAGGALAVLAGLVGVKYGKAAATGLLAVALVFLKKAWIILLLPFLWIGKLFNRKKKNPE